MNLFFSDRDNHIGITRLNRGCYFKIILFLIEFSLASFYEDINDNLNQGMLEVKLNLDAQSDMLAQSKAFVLKCETESIVDIDDFMRTIINHTRPKDNSKKISMMVTNRNFLKLNTNESKLLIFDLALKCVENKEDIFDKNIFVINDILKLVEDNKKAIEHVKKMNYNLDILFFDEFSIINLPFLLHKLFKNIEWYNCDSKPLIFHYLISNSENLRNYVNSLLLKIKEEQNVCYNNVLGFAYHITKDKEEYKLIKLDIKHGCLEDSKDSLESQQKKIIEKGEEKEVKEGLWCKLSIYDNGVYNVRTEIKESLEANKNHFFELTHAANESQSISESVNIQPLKNNNINYYKDILFISKKETIPNRNLFKVSVYVCEKLKYDITSLSTEVMHFYNVDKNDIIEKGENSIKYEQAKRTCLDKKKRIELNLKKCYQPFNIFKSIFFLMNNDWVKHECILLKGKKTIYFTELKNLEFKHIKEKILLLKNNLFDNKNRYTDEFFYDINSSYINSKDKCFHCFKDKKDFFNNFAVNSEFKALQRPSKLKGIVYTVKGKYYENNYYICLIPLAIINNRYFDVEKAVFFFNQKINNFWQMFKTNADNYNEEIFSTMIYNEYIQSIPSDLLHYLSSTEADIKSKIEYKIHLVLKENIIVNKLCDKELLQNILMKENVIEFILKSINEMITEIYQYVYDKKSGIFINSEFNYINNDFAKILEECKNVFPVLED